MAKAQLQSLNAHAKQRLARDKIATLKQGEKLELYKRFLKTEEHRIKLYHRSGGSGLRVTGRRAELIDVLLRNLYEDAVEAAQGKSPGVTLVATGGYGRGRLNPCSDIDLLFLHPKGAAGLPKIASDMVESILYMLYDCGFKVGHAVRSVKETVKEGNTDVRTKSSLIEARLLVGDEAIFKEMMTAFYKSCIRGQERDYLKIRLEDIRLRHIKWHGTPFLQEPHVKEGCGSLRDYQNLIWITYVRRATTSLKELVTAKLLTQSAYREMRKAYDFLLRVRNELHYEQGRATDILTLRLQGVVAKNLGYPQRSLLRKIEAFMRDYYTHTNNLFLRGSELGDRFYLEEREADNKAIVTGFLARRKFSTEKFDGFVAKNNRIYADPKNPFKEDPHRLIRLFQHSQQRHLRLAPPLFSLVQKSWKLIDREYRYSAKNRAAFEAILARRGDVGRALRQMHRVGVLGRYLPEFGALTNLVQHEFFHRYSADEHTLRVVEQLDGLATVSDDDHRCRLYRDLFHEMDDPFVLYLAILLHDSGRATNATHHDDASAILALQVARRFCLKPKRRQLLLFLVDSHLELWRTANSKNIDDPNTIASFAQIIGNQRNLDYLMLLTFADSRGTREEAWTETKESPLRFLYHETSDYLKDAEAFAFRHREAQDSLLNEVLGQMPESHHSTVVAHFQEMPLRYFARREADHIVRHVEMLVEYFKNWAFDQSTPALHWRAMLDQGASELCVLWEDHHLLLGNIAGALAANKINILSAEIFIRNDKVVFDLFRVCTTNFEPVTRESKQKAVREVLGRALSGEQVHFEELIDKADDDFADWHELEESFPQRVYVNNINDPEHTMVEIQAIDRLGLLYSIFRAIGELDLEITNARIMTTSGAAIDTLYVVDEGGNKISDEALLNKLENSVQRAVGIVE